MMPTELERHIEKQRRLVGWLREAHGRDHSLTRQMQAVLEELEHDQRVRVHHRRRNAEMDEKRTFPLSMYLEDADPSLRRADSPADNSELETAAITGKLARQKTTQFYRLSPDTPTPLAVPVGQRVERLWADGRAARLLKELDEPGLSWEELWDRFCTEFHAKHPRLAERYGVPAPATR